jgi:hypothetical protein
MYNGYTNDELFSMFRAKTNKQHNFLLFLNSLPENPVCQTSRDTSEITLQSDSILHSTLSPMDLQDGESLEQISTLKNSISNPAPITELDSDSSENSLPSQEAEDVLELLEQT